jgi:hypothetical protein
LGIAEPLRLDLIEIFLKYNYATFYAIPRPIFLQYAHKMPPILLTSIYAIASIYEPIECGKAPQNGRGLEFYLLGRKMVDEYSDTPSALVVLALSLLMTYSILSGKCNFSIRLPTRN